MPDPTSKDLNLKLETRNFETSQGMLSAVQPVHERSIFCGGGEGEGPFALSALQFSNSRFLPAHSKIDIRQSKLSTFTLRSPLFTIFHALSRYLLRGGGGPAPRHPRFNLQPSPVANSIRKEKAEIRNDSSLNDITALDTREITRDHEKHTEKTRDFFFYPAQIDHGSRQRRSLHHPTCGGP